MNTKLVRLAGNPRAGVAVEIEIKGEPVKTMTTTKLNSTGIALNPRTAEAAVKTELRKSFTRETETEIHVHKNSDGSYAYAVGAEPATWPEDEVVPK